MERPTLTGIIQSGAGKGATFTQVGWVVAQCRRMLGYEPFPGTLNVRVNDRDLDSLEDFLQDADFELVPDDPTYCSARLKRVTLNGIPAAVVLPSEDVRIHEKRVLEIIAGFNLKEVLGLGDGDCVTIASDRARIDEPVTRESDPSDRFEELYAFASSAGALEGYVYPVETRDMSHLDNWINNLVKQYRALPESVRISIQTQLDRTLGRAVQSLETELGKDHRNVLALRSMLKGEIPASPHDFEREKKEKAEQYGE
ncbi:MAG: CTP-dependent riboflavin kinase [Desulfobacteraceae bacterium]|jgi:hypothetical protein